MNAWANSQHPVAVTRVELLMGSMKVRPDAMTYSTWLKSKSNEQAFRSNGSSVSIDEATRFCTERSRLEAARILHGRRRKPKLPGRATTTTLAGRLNGLKVGLIVGTKQDIYIRPNTCNCASGRRSKLRKISTCVNTCQITVVEARTIRFPVSCILEPCVPVLKH
jgi:hypothetical protein